jgi:LPS O-antigen subunit length determinant protein (WzzB/FepE family)
MDTIYYFRQDKEKYNRLTLSPKVELVWQTLKASINKSDLNHRQYENSKSDKEETVIQEEKDNADLGEQSNFINIYQIDNSKKYYKYDTNHSQSINSMIESNKGSLSLGAVRNSIINEIEKDGWEPKEANNIYEEIISTVRR